MRDAKQQQGSTFRDTGRTAPGTEGKVRPKGKNKEKLPPNRIWLWFLAILALNYLMVSFLTPDAEARQRSPTPCSAKRCRGETSMRYTIREKTCGGTFALLFLFVSPEAAKTGTTGTKKNVTFFTTTLPSFIESGLETFLINHGVEISACPMHEERTIWRASSTDSVRGFSLYFSTFGSSEIAARGSRRVNGSWKEQGLPLRQ